MSDSQLRFAGQFKIHKAEYAQLNGGALDIRNQIESFTIFQDLYSHFITARLNLRDSQDLPSFFGRSNTDMFIFELETPGVIYDKHPSYGELNAIRHHFMVYKMGDRVLAKDRQQVYTYYLISMSSLYDSITQVSKKYKGQISEIVNKELVKLQNASGLIKEPAVGINYGKTTDSLGSAEFISNFWNPTKILNFLREHAVDPVEPGSPFFLYETFDGFNFKSLRSLIDKKQHHYFTTDDFSADIVNEGATELIGRVSRNPLIDFTVVQEMRVDANFDTIKQLQTGGVFSKLISFDPITKAYQTRLFSGDELNGRLKLNDYEMVRSDVFSSLKKIYTNTPSNIMLMHKNYALFENNRTKSSSGVISRYQNSNTDHANIQTRMFLTNAFQHKVEIDVFGRLDYRVGDKAFLNVNKTSHIAKEMNFDDYSSKLYTGFYIITAIAHNFGQASHRCTIELSKESTDAQ